MTHIDASKFAANCRVYGWSERASEWARANAASWPPPREPATRCQFSARKISNAANPAQASKQSISQVVWALMRPLKRINFNISVKTACFIFRSFLKANLFDNGLFFNCYFNSSESQRKVCTITYKFHTTFPHPRNLYKNCAVFKERDLWYSSQSNKHLTLILWEIKGLTKATRFLWLLAKCLISFMDLGVFHPVVLLPILSLL